MLLADRVSAGAFIFSLAAHALFLGAFPRGESLVAVPPPRLVVEMPLELRQEIPDIRAFGERLQTPAPAAEPARSETLDPSPVPLSAPDLGAEAFLRYQDAVKRALQQSRRYPAWAKKQGYAGTVLLRFLVYRSGAVEGVRISRSSGYRILDEEASATVARAAPFAPAPAALSGDRWEMRVAIVFSLD